MKYTVRPNPKAYNPVTGLTDPKKVWEVAQHEWAGGTGHDSEQVSWLCAEVKINGVPITEVIATRTSAQTPAEKLKVAEKGMEFYGICTRDQDNAISIREGRTDVS